MLPILDDIKASASGVSAASEAGQALEDLNRGLGTLDALWLPHITIEEQHETVEALAALIEPGEHIRLGQAFAQHSQQHSGPNYLLVPFLLYNLPPQEREIFALALPPIVAQQLVPIVWKEQWAPMQPFLLD